MKLPWKVPTAGIVPILFQPNLWVIPPSRTVQLSIQLTAVRLSPLGFESLATVVTTVELTPLLQSRLPSIRIKSLPLTILEVVFGFQVAFHLLDLVGV